MLHREPAIGRLVPQGRGAEHVGAAIHRQIDLALALSIPAVPYTTGVTNSPIVDKTTTPGIRFGYLYRF